MDDGIEHVAVLLHSLQDTAERLHVLERARAELLLGQAAQRVGQVGEVLLQGVHVEGRQ